MNKVIKKGAVALGAFSAAAVGVCGILAREVVARKPVFIQKIFNMFSVEGEGEHNHSNEYSKEKFLEYDNWCKSKNCEEFVMTARDGKKLYSYLIPCEKDSDVYVLCAHGYRGTRYGDFGAQAQFYHSLGFNVILIDQRAMGKSEGETIGFGYLEYADCIEWLNFYIEKFGKNIKFIVAGISMGGATVCMMSGSADLPLNVKCIISDCAYTSAVDELKYCLKHYINFPGALIVPVVNAANKVVSGYSFKSADPLSGVKNARVPMLFIHGKADDFVPTEMVYKLYDACTAQKDLLIVDNAVHAQSYFESTAEYREKVKEFLDKYL